MKAGAFLNHDKKVPAKPVLRTAISLGYPASPPRRGSRKPISELVYEERYRTSA